MSGFGGFHHSFQLFGVADVQRQLLLPDDDTSDGNHRLIMNAEVEILFFSARITDDGNGVLASHKKIGGVDESHERAVSMMVTRVCDIHPMTIDIHFA